MQITAAELPSRLDPLSPLYLVHGDEPLLVIEAGDLIRGAARAAGCEDREVLVVEPGFKWDVLLASTRNLGLFGSRKLIDLRIPSGKPGVDGARALESWAASPSMDAVALITMPRLDRAAQGSAWFSAVDNAGIVVTVQTLDRHALPAWIAARLSRSRQRASRETLQFLADTTEGNLLATQQEIDKLALLLPEGELDPSAVEQVITDVARFDVFQLSEAWLSGDAARACRILGAMESAGEGAPLIVWQLGEDLHALASVLTATTSGTHISAALRNARVWGKRQGAMERALRRVKPGEIPAMLLELAKLDALAKGIGRGNVWESLRALALALAGRPLTAAT